MNVQREVYPTRGTNFRPSFSREIIPLIWNIDKQFFDDESRVTQLAVSAYAGWNRNKKEYEFVINYTFLKYLCDVTRVITILKNII